MVLRQQVDIAQGDRARLTMVKPAVIALTLNLRIPAWVIKPVVVKINGKPQNVEAKPTSYVSLKRKWKARDVIELILPAALRLEQARDDSSMVSIFNGPVLLAGELGKDEMPGSNLGDKDAFLKIATAPVPDIVSTSSNPADWLNPVTGDTSAFKMKDAGPANGIVLRPLFELHHQRYSVYWRLRKDTVRTR